MGHDSGDTTDAGYTTYAENPALYYLRIIQFLTLVLLLFSLFNYG